MSAPRASDLELLLHAIAERVGREPDELRLLGVDTLLSRFAASLTATRVPSGVFDASAAHDWCDDAETPVVNEPLLKRFSKE